jgi:hypothetical protein
MSTVARVRRIQCRLRLIRSPFEFVTIATFCFSLVWANLSFFSYSFIHLKFSPFSSSICRKLKNTYFSPFFTSFWNNQTVSFPKVLFLSRIFHALHYSKVCEIQQDFLEWQTRYRWSETTLFKRRKLKLKMVWFILEISFGTLRYQLTR